MYVYCIYIWYEICRHDNDDNDDGDDDDDDHLVQTNVAIQELQCGH